jgi:prolyl oligopeptidase
MRHFIALVAIFAGTAGLWAQSPPRPPATRTDDVKEGLQGVEVADPYRWLEDQQSPETRAWIDSQNRYTRSLLDSWPQRELMKRRVSELLKIDSIDVPMERNGRLFFVKRLASQDQGILYMRKITGGRDEVLVDPNPLNSGHTVSVTLEGVSEDGTLVAYSLRQGGEDETSIHLFNASKRAKLPDDLPRARYFGISLRPDKTGFYYSRQGEQGPRVYYHKMGTPPPEDAEVFGKGYGADKIILADLSEDGRYLIIHVLHGSAGDKTEVYYQDLQSKRPIMPIVNDVSARFSGEVGGQTLYLHTNWNAPNSRILAVDLRNPARSHWREVITEGSSVIDSLAVAAGKLFLTYTENASSRVRIFDGAGKYLRDLELPALGSVTGINGRWSSQEAFFGYESFHIPLSVYRYQIAANRRSLWAQVKVPIHAERLEVKQVWYASKDGTQVPMFIVHRKNLKLDGANPALLTGYGGFNVSETPYFSAMAALWVESGGVFAEPNLRGGGEFGESWHRAGMLEKKQNVFDDFIAAAQWLVQNRYTEPSKLAIMGASNGGLLVGAALTERPDLFRVVLCFHPLLDMLRYQKFMQAQFWVSEYGSADDREQFKYLYAYSPYHHLVPGTKYPAVLFLTGDGDTRVAPLHARKMAARLQAATASGLPVLIRYDTQAGHSAGLPVSRRVDEYTDVMEFLFWQLQVSLTP